MTTPQKQCPKWESCSAAVCPLDRSGKHKKNDPICFYVLEAVKPGARERFEKSELGALLSNIAKEVAWVRNLCADLDRRAERASLTGSRMQ